MAKHGYWFLLNRSIKYFCCLGVCLICLLAHPAFAQRPAEKDSLLQLLKTLPDDTNKVNILNRLCFICRANDFENSITYGEQALKLSEKLDFQRGKALSYFNQGRVYRVVGSYDKAIFCQSQAKNIFQSLKDSIQVANSLRELGIVYRRKGEFPESLKYSLRAIQIYERAKFRIGEANTATSIGAVYYRQKNYKKSLEYYLKALSIHQELGAKESIAIDFNNLGNVYVEQKQFEKSLYYYEKYKKIKEELNDQRGIAIALSNMGYVYGKQRKIELSITYQEQALMIYERLGLEKYQIYPLQSLGESYAFLKKFKKAIDYGHRALKIAEKVKGKNNILETTLSLSEIYEQSKNYKEALRFYRKYRVFTDSVFNVKKSQQITEMQTKYETEKKEQENKFLKREDAKNKALIKQRNNLIGTIAFGALLLVILAVLLYQSNQRKQRTNQLLLTQKREIEIQTEEILAQRDMLEQQHKDIRDSINYARKIQTAILPLPEEISAAIPEHFIFYQPRDIVSGDFYWFAKINNEETDQVKYVISASDCTGHGVPGAFMSMIGNDLLNDIVKARQITQPDVILNHLHKGVRKALHQETGENTDGMDISLCVIDPTEKKVSYAGANSALVYVKNGERTRIAPEQTSIGGDMSKHQQGFVAHTISYADAPLTCYLYTDGYRDQFGGERGKKFMRSRFQELIFYISQMTMQDQRRQVEATINDWMAQGGLEQMDDMLVLGFRLS